MLEKIFWSFAIIVVLGAIFMIVTVVRNKYMWLLAPAGQFLSGAAILNITGAAVLPTLGASLEMLGSTGAHVFVSHNGDDHEDRAEDHDYCK